LFQTFSRFAAFPPFWAELKKRFRAFFGTRCLSCVVVKFGVVLMKYPFLKGRYALIEKILVQILDIIGFK
jgi:hypothetical protein